MTSLNTKLTNLLEAYREVNRLEQELTTYLNRQFDPETNRLNDDTPSGVVRELNRLIACERGELPPAFVTPSSELPSQLIEAYEVLHTQAYGTDRLYYGDPNKLPDSGKPLRARLSSGQRETSGPAVQKKANAYRSIILNEAAFHLKSKIDKKLRSIARSIYQELNGGLKMPSRCGCGRFIDPTPYCPYCGQQQQKEVSS